MAYEKWVIQRCGEGRNVGFSPRSSTFPDERTADQRLTFLHEITTVGRQLKEASRCRTTASHCVA